MKKAFCISEILFLLGNVLVGCPFTMPTTPAILSFRINDNAASTNNRLVTLNTICLGIPTAYMASESATFEDASWKTYTAAPSFPLSSGGGLKTVYIKVKNALGETSALNDTIILNEDNNSITEETIMLPGNVPLTMVWCPAGTFMMGSKKTEQGSWDGEKPQHPVTLTQGFWIGKYEVTKGQWTAIMGTTPWGGQFFGTNDPDSAVVCISWDDAQSFITALNNYTGLTFRFPSEAQWEYACRAGTTTRFYWGEDPGFMQIEDYAWYYGNAAILGADHYAHRVGEKLANAWGLYDMNGNVWEWCQDWWEYGYYTSSEIDPTGPSDGLVHLLRGGGWVSGSYECRSASRYHHNTRQVDKNYDIGFRLAR